MSLRNIPFAIRGTASALPPKCLSTAQILEQSTLSSTVEELERITGIQNRHWVDELPAVASLAVQAVRGALEDAGMEPSALRRLILTNSTGGDHLFPSTSSVVLKGLGISETCPAFDLNNGCMGFLTALDAAGRAVATGVGPVAVVSTEVFSPYITPEEPRPYMVFGDGAAAAILGDPTTPDEGILGSYYSTLPTHLMSVALHHPGVTGRNETVDFSASNRQISEAAVEAFAHSAGEAAAASGLTLAEISWIVPHQPNGNMLRKIMDRLGFAMDRVVPVVRDIGNVGSAAMAFGLDALRRQRRVSAGETILFVGVGAGGVYGAAIYRVGSWRTRSETEG